MNSTATNKTTVLEELEPERCEPKMFWEHISKLVFSAPMDHTQQARKNEKQDKAEIPFAVLSKQTRYIFWYQEAVEFATTMLKLLFCR